MNSLALVDTKNQGVSIWESNEDLKQIKEIYGKNLSAGEWNTLVQMGRATGLSPYLKEIWAVKYGNNPAQIFIGRDGYRKSAQRHPLYDYHVADAVYSGDEFFVVDGEIKHKYNLTNRGELVGAYCIVKRKGSSRTSYVYVELKEYSTGQSLWKNAGADKGKPATMIKKVAEAQGLKSGFQELFANTYSEYEAWEYQQSDSGKKTGKGVSGLKEKLGLIQSEYDNDSSAEDFSAHNIETGEVIEAEIDIFDEEEPKKPNLDTIKFQMESAANIKELLEAAKTGNDLPEENKKEIRALFNKKSAELKGKN